MVQMMSVVQQEHSMEVHVDSVVTSSRSGLRFEEGLLGFPQVKDFCVVDLESAAPFKLLAAADCSGLEFVMVDPHEFCPEYRVTLSGSELSDLQLDSPHDAEVYVLVVIPPDPSQMTANLRGPLVINRKKGLGKQVILLSNEYSTSHSILEEIRGQR